jgi:tryptophanyl-tRNA synthetase
MAQDMAERFNNAYQRQVLVRPEPKPNAAPVVPATDADRALERRHS